MNELKGSPITLPNEEIARVDQTYDKIYTTSASINLDVHRQISFTREVTKISILNEENTSTRTSVGGRVSYALPSLASTTLMPMIL